MRPSRASPAVSGVLDGVCRVAATSKKQLRASSSRRGSPTEGSARRRRPARPFASTPLTINDADVKPRCRYALGLEAGISAVLAAQEHAAVSRQQASEALDERRDDAGASLPSRRNPERERARACRRTFRAVVDEIAATVSWKPVSRRLRSSRRRRRGDEDGASSAGSAVEHPPSADLGRSAR